MKKHPNPETNIPKDVAQSQKDIADFVAKFNKEMDDVKKHFFGLEGRLNKQTTEYKKITKELSVANQVMKKQQKEIDRLEQNFSS